MVVQERSIVKTRHTLLCSSVLNCKWKGMRYLLHVLNEEFVIGYICSSRFTQTQMDTCMRSVSDTGESCIQLTMREDRVCKVNTYTVQSESLTAVECRCICRRQRELFAMESVT